MYLEVVSTWSRIPTGEVDWTVSREFETEKLLMGLEIRGDIRSKSCLLWIRFIWRYIWCTGFRGFVVLCNVRFLIMSGQESLVGNAQTITCPTSG